MSKNETQNENAETDTSGVARKSRESHRDITIRRGNGDDVFVKAGDDVLLLDETEARILATEIRETVDTDTQQEQAQEEEIDGDD
jgi:hypothetical protein